MTATLSDAAKQTYLQTGGHHCPFCQSHNLSADAVEGGDGWLSQGVRCDDCNEEWMDIYHMVAVELP